jgi:hypothetical protein
MWHSAFHDRRLIRFPLGLLFCAIAAHAADNSGLLDRIRRGMAENLTRLPNYTCMETIERTRKPFGYKHFNLIDRLRLEVAYVGGRELYAWPGAGTLEDKPIEELVGKGAAIGAGSFGMHARAVFASSAPEFTWAGDQERLGHKTVRFDFQVPQNRSRYAIQTGARPVIVAYGGSFEADVETLAPLWLEVRADNPPAELKLRSASEIIHYSRMRIGESDFLLPVESDLTMVDGGGGESRNVTRFENCRQYAGNSEIRFDVVDIGGDVSQLAIPIELPGGMLLETQLREAVELNHSARGDAVHLVVTSDAKRSGRVVVPKGAVVVGRVTWLDTSTVRSMVYVNVGLELHSIEFGGRRGKFSGEVTAAGIGPNYSIRASNQRDDDSQYIVAKMERLPAGTRIALRTK